MTISSPSGGGGPTPTLGSSSSITTTITDDDDVTGIALSASPASIGEDDNATTVTVTATLGGGGTRTDGHGGDHRRPGRVRRPEDTDYTATSLTSVTIPANATSGAATLTITPTDDEVVEGDETIIIPGTTAVAGLSVTSATITLTDDDKGTTNDPNDVDKADLSIAGPATTTEGSNAEFMVTSVAPRWTPRVSSRSGA